MKASKGNKVYTISEGEKSSFVAQGYDITNDKGEVVEYGKGKTVDYNKYMQLKKENEELKKSIELLEAGQVSDGEERTETDENAEKEKSKKSTKK